MPADVLPLFPDLDPVAPEATEDDIVAQALAILERRHRRGQPLSCPADTFAFLRLQLGELEREVFVVVFLDNRHRVLAREMLALGTIDGASVHPREVVKAALRHNAAAVILAHNHPSGVAEPSQADEHITRRLREAMQLVDVRVLDHVVVAAGGCVSFAERGLL